jgi:multicomponent K+:H+ antiporter subunit A
MVFVSWRLARRVERLFGTRRLQPQLRLIVGIAIMLAGVPRSGCAGSGRATLAEPAFDPVLALVWCVGGACAIGAASRPSSTAWRR